MSNRHNWIIFGVLSALLVLFNSLYVVDQRNKVLLFAFGEVKGEGGAPGLHFKRPFLVTARNFSARIQRLDKHSETMTTADHRNVDVEFDALWRIDDTAVFYRATGGQELVAGDRLARIIVAQLRDRVGALDLADLVAASGEGGGIATPLLDSVSPQVAELGIKPVDVRVTNLALPKEALESVYARMRSERDRVASDLRARGFEQAEKIRAEAERAAETAVADAYRDAEILRGEGDARSAEISAKAYGQDPEFYAFYRSLAAYRESFKDRRDVLVVEPKGEFFRYFHQPGGAPPGGRESGR